MRCLIGVIVLLTACTSVPKSPILTDIQADSPALPELKLAPSAFGGAASLAQQLTWQIENVHALSNPSFAARPTDALVEIDADNVRMAFFAISQRILNLSWNGAVLKTTRHPLLPKELEPNKILRDLQLNYWPSDTIRAALPEDWSLNDTEDQRELIYRGQAQISIHYAAQPRWLGRTVLVNRIEHYKLIIESTQQSAP